MAYYSRSQAEKCMGKIRMTQGEAEKKAALSSEIRKEDWSAYLCGFCSHWHIGHTPKRVRTKREAKKRYYKNRKDKRDDAIHD